MAFKLAEAYVELAPKGFESVGSAVGGVKGQLQSLGGAAQSLTSSFDNLANTISLGLGAAAAGAVQNLARALASAATEMVKLSAQAQSRQIDFEVLLGSPDKAKALLADMRQLAAATPLSFSDVSGGAQTMLGFGVKEKDVLPMLRMLGDVSGGNSEKFKSLALAASQVSAAGKLMGQDLLQLINAGFNPLQEISKRTGQSMAELRASMEHGGISVQMFQQALIDATSEGGRFFERMEKQGSSMLGLWNQIADAVTQAKTRMGDALSKGLSLEETTKDVKTVSSALGGWIDQNEEAIASGVRFASYANGFQNITAILRQIAGASGDAATGMEKLAEAAGGMQNALGVDHDKITRLLDTLAGLRHFRDSGQITEATFRQQASTAVFEAGLPDGPSSLENKKLQEISRAKAELRRLQADAAGHDDVPEEQAAIEGMKTKLRELTGATKSLAEAREHLNKLKMGPIEFALHGMRLAGDDEETVEKMRATLQETDDLKKAMAADKEAESFLQETIRDTEVLSGKLTKAQAEFEKLKQKFGDRPAFAKIASAVAEKDREEQAKKAANEAKKATDGQKKAEEKIADLQARIDIATGRKTQAQADLENFRRENPHATNDQVERFAKASREKDALDNRKSPQYVSFADLNKTMQASVQPSGQLELLKKANEQRDAAARREIDFNKKITNDGIKIENIADLQTGNLA